MMSYKSVYLKEEEADTKKIIGDLIDTGWSGSNDEQMKAVQLMKGLATSDDPAANKFMKKIDNFTSGLDKSEFTEGCKKGGKKPGKRMVEGIPGPVEYNVYYMDNDRQRKIVAKNLPYQKAVSFMQKNYGAYGADLMLEPMDESRKLSETKNIDVIETFCLDAIPKYKLRVANVCINVLDNGDYVLINYTTGIALRVPDAEAAAGWKIILNNRKYSVTTSKIQNYIRRTCESGQVPIEEMDERAFNAYGSE